MRQRFWMLSLVICLFGCAGQSLAQKDEAKPVEVKVETVKHDIQMADYRAEDSMYPANAGDKVINEARDKRNSYIEKVEAELIEKRPELKDMNKRERRNLVMKQLEDDAAYQKLDQAWREARGAAYKTVKSDVEVVTLRNEYVEVKLVPRLGMRVLNAVNLKTNTSFAGTDDPRWYEKEPFTDYLGWTAGFIEPSYPYFEHGVGVTKSPAGYRVIKNDDGSVTVAMQMRFTQFQHPRHMARYGRFDQRVLSSWVTLRPAETKFSVTYRLDNPNPTRRGDRLWTNILLDVDKYDGEHIIYPVGYIMPHGAGWAKPFYAEGGSQSWRNVSHFGLYSEHAFMGIYDPDKDVNTVIITDREKAPGQKLYTRNQEGGFLELWTGHGVVFEDAGDFVQAYEPVEFTLHFYQVAGAGRVVWADENLAVTRNAGGYHGIPTKSGDISYSMIKGDVWVAAGSSIVDAGEELHIGGPEKVEIKFDLESLGDKFTLSLPLTYQDTRDKHPKVKSLGGKLRLEKEQITNHIGAPRDWSAIGLAKKLVEKGEVGDPELAMSYARVAYRYGNLDLAKQVADLVGETPEADYVRALVAWEQGAEPKDIDFGKAGLESSYLRAMLAIRLGDKDKAEAILKAYLLKQPDAWRPRLVWTYLRGDLDDAKALSAKQPASLAALKLREMLGDESATAEIEQLSKGVPGAAYDLEQFERECKQGLWQHMPRYAPLLPDQHD